MASKRFLHDLIGDKRWDEAKKRMRTEEGKAEPMGRELKGRGPFLGCYPLQVACWHGAPFHLVESMLGERPELARLAGISGDLALHNAFLCTVGDVSPRVVRLLLDTYPEGSKVTDHRSHLPLHDAAWVMAPSGVLSMLIDVHPDGAATPTNHGLLPIHLLASQASPKNEEHVESVKALLQPILNNDEMLLLRYSRETPLDIAARFDVLSVRTCVTTERCPAEVIILTARRHREQLRSRDDDGNYPLHFVASNPYLNGARVLSKAPIGEPRDNGDEEGVEAGDDDGDEAGGDERSVEPSEAGVDESGEANENAEGEKDFIDEFVKLNPEAAAAQNADGTSPLCLAIESGKKWHEGVEAIADAAKHVVVIRDEASGLYPFMLAAAGDNSCLTTVYSLLRRCPEIKRYILD